MVNLWIMLLVIKMSSSVPLNRVQNFAETDFQEFQNYLPKLGDLPKYEYSSGQANNRRPIEDVFRSADSDIAINLVNNFDGENFAFNNEEILHDPLNSTEILWDPENQTKAFFIEEIFNGTDQLAINVSSIKIKLLNSTDEKNNNFNIATDFNEREIEKTNSTNLLGNVENHETGVYIDPINGFNETLSNSTFNGNRTARQEVMGTNKTRSDPEFSRQENDEEEDGNMITELLSGFLGGLSKPDGTVDVDAIVGLLGSLSVQNPDGSYDFNGLTELLRGTFGGDEDGGGSDFGAFTGGLLGAFIKGVAKPPGPRGAGILSGNLLTGILPALSAPPEEEGKPPSQTLDSGSFLTGFLQTVVGGIAGGSSGNSSSGSGNSGDSSGNSGDSSGNSGDSSGNSGNSGDSSGNSGDSSGNSGDSSGNSGDSSGNSGDSSGNSGNSGDTSKNSGNSGDSSRSIGGQYGGNGGSGFPIIKAVLSSITSIFTRSFQANN